MESCLDFILYLALEEVLGLENKRKISLKDLNNYRMGIYNSLNQFYDDVIFQIEDYESIVYEYLNVNKSMNEREFIREIKEIVSEDDSLYIENGYVIISDDLDLKELNSKKFETDIFNDTYGKELCYEIMRCHNEPELLKRLDINDAIEYLNKLIKFEKFLYNLYLNDDLSNKNGFIDHFRLIVSSLKRKLVDMDIFKFSKYWSLYDKIIMPKLDDVKSVLNEETDSDLYYMHNLEITIDLESMFIQAIFDGDNIMYDKLENTFELLDYSKIGDYDSDVSEEAYYDDDSYSSDDERYFDSEEDEPYEDEYSYLEDNYFEEEYDFESDDTAHKSFVDGVFYLMYVDCINNYQKKYGVSDELECVKNKLLYLLSEYNNYSEENIQLYINNYKANPLDDKVDLRRFYIMSRIFIIDIINSEIDSNTLKKILFIDNYYGISNNKIIRKILEDNRDSKVGKIIYDAVINHNYDTGLKKSLIKKQNKN